MTSAKPRRALANMLNDSTTPASAFAKPQNNDYAKGHLQSKKQVQLFEDFLKDRLNQLKQDKGKMHHEHEQVIASTWLKMSKSDRNMSLEAYERKYHVDLVDAIPPPSIPTPASGVPSIPMTPALGFLNGHPNTRAKAVMPRGRLLTTPATVRAVRRGEGVFSEHGSPLDPLEDGCLVATVVAPRHRPRGAVAGAKHAANGAAIVDAPASPEIDFHVGAGQCVSLKDVESLQHLDAHAKEMAAAQIRIMKVKMDNILASLEQQPETS